MIQIYSLQIRILLSHTVKPTELNKLYTWLCVNKLSIHIDNTNYIAFCNEHENFVTSIGINNINLQSLLNKISSSVYRFIFFIYSVVI